jgi:hypothetical protein
MGIVLQDNPRTLSAGINHDKRELLIVIARSREDVGAAHPFETQIIMFPAVGQERDRLCVDGGMDDHRRSVITSGRGFARCPIAPTVRAEFVECSLETMLEIR